VSSIDDNHRVSVFWVRSPALAGLQCHRHNHRTRVSRYSEYASSSSDNSSLGHSQGNCLGASHPLIQREMLDRVVLDILVQKSSRSNLRILVTHYVVGANSTLMVLARGFGVSRATRRAYQLICERKRVACTFLYSFSLTRTRNQGIKITSQTDSYDDLRSIPMSYSRISSPEVRVPRSSPSRPRC
jgi:hypothetical protein